MEELVLYLAKSLVDKPEMVELRTSDLPADPAGGPSGKLLELKVAPEDVGKVIGRDGRTVNAMRSLLTQLAQRKGVKARLEVLDDKKSAQATAQAAAQATGSHGPPPPSA